MWSIGVTEGISNKNGCEQMRLTEPDFQNYLKTLNMRFEGTWDIPKVKGVHIKNLKQVELLGFNYCTQTKLLQEGNKFVHFFLPDYYIERVWNNLEHYEAVFSAHRGIVQPDFSLYTDMPRAMQIWQHYRRNWVAQYYQSRGIHVIPSPTWGEEDSFEFCFEGMPKGSCLAISTVGMVSNKENRRIFNIGFNAVLEQLEPSQLIIYGAMTDAIREKIRGIPYKHIESEQKQRMQKYSEKIQK